MATSSAPASEIRTLDDLILASDKEKEALYQSLQLTGASNLRQQTEQLMQHLGFKKHSPRGQAESPVVAAPVAAETASSPAESDGLIAAMITKLQLTMETRFDDVRAQTNELHNSHKELSGRHLNLFKQVQELKQDNIELRAKVQSLEEVRGQSDAVALTVQQILTGEQTIQAPSATTPAGTLADAAEEVALQQRKAANVVLRNLPECNSREDAEHCVPELLSHLGPDLKTTILHFRSPPSAAAASAGPQGRPRGNSVVVQFASVQEKWSIYRSLKNLRDTKFRNTHVDDDLTHNQAQVKKELWPTYQRLREEGKRPHWRGAKIFVDRKEYRPTTHTQRPPSTSAPLSATATSFEHPNPHSPLASHA